MSSRKLAETKRTDKASGEGMPQAGGEVRPRMPARSQQRRIGHENSNTPPTHALGQPTHSLNRSPASRSSLLSTINHLAIDRLRLRVADCCMGLCRSPRVRLHRLLRLRVSLRPRVRLHRLLRSRVRESLDRRLGPHVDDRWRTGQRSASGRQRRLVEVQTETLT